MPTPTCPKCGLRFIDHISKACPSHLLKQVKPFGGKGSGHVTLPRAWVGRRVRVTLEE